MLSSLTQIYSNPGTNIIFNIFIFIFGLCFGSFLNVCIYRIPRKESIIFIPSHCTSCSYKIKFYENIPILGWIILKGKCSNCKEKISPIYPLIELLTGILISLLWLFLKNSNLPLSVFLIYIILTFLMIPAFVIDLKYQIIPNRLTYTALILSLIFSYIFPETMNYYNRYSALLNSLAGAAVPFIIFYLFSLIGRMLCKKEVIGLGDIKFISVIGAAFGYSSYYWLFIFIISSFLGAVFGLFMILLRKKSWLTAVPFGPFLVIGSYIWIFFGEFLKNIYLDLLQKFLL